jgi:phage tail-like protein
MLQIDPLTSYNYSLYADSITAGYFTSCDGLGSETDIISHEAVDVHGYEYVLKVPGRVKYTDLTLKRGITTSTDFWNWRLLVEDGHLAEAVQNATIFMHHQTGIPVAMWELTNAWPSKISGPTFGSDANEIGVEELTITFEYFRRKPIRSPF